MTNKKYEELIPNRIFIGGVDAIDDLLTNENIDVIYDLRAEVTGALSSDKSLHQPIGMMPSNKMSPSKLRLKK